MDSRILVISSSFPYKEHFTRCALEQSIYVDYTSSLNSATTMLTTKNYRLILIRDHEILSLTRLFQIRRLSDAYIAIFTYKTKNIELQNILAGHEDTYDVYIETHYIIDIILPICIALVNKTNEPDRDATGNFTIQYGGVEIDISTKRVFVNGMHIKISRTEYKILKYFLHNKGYAVTHEQIYADVWNAQWDIKYKYLINNHIYNLRKKLTAASGELKPEYIETIYGVGYRLVDLNKIAEYT